MLEPLFLCTFSGASSKRRGVGEAHAVEERHDVASHDDGAVGIDSGVGGRHSSGEQHFLSVDGVCES